MTRHGEHRAGIYAIEHLPTGRLYIGSSANISQRWSDHRRTLNRGTHCSVDLQCAWTQDGPAAFAFHILEVCERDRAILADYEQGYIDAFAPKFNRRMRTTRSSLGARYPRFDITECPQGHAYDEANTGYSTRNQRYCRECARLRVTAKYTPKTVRRDGPTCKRGHEWAPGNTRILDSGTRQCIACSDLRAKVRYERAQLAEAREKSRAQKRADFQKHREARRADNRARDKARRQKHIEERIARGEKPGTLATCRKGHPWTPENTIQEAKRRLCRTCHDAARSMTPEQHAAHLAQRRDRERATWHDANQRAYARRKVRMAN